MNIGELKKLVSDGESDRLEFKRSTGQRTQAAKTACAMLNGLGGLILFGINDNGDFVGQQVTAKTLEDVSAEMRRIEPQAFPIVETFDIGKEKTIIVVHMTGGRGLYTFDSRPYIRQGPTTRIMPHGEYNKRLMETLHSTRRWENEPVANGVSI
jgi:ATP-dependent DNA helicase RecG